MATTNKDLFTGEQIADSDPQEVRRVCSIAHQGEIGSYQVEPEKDQESGQEDQDR